MANVYYGGVSLPKIPSLFTASYANVVIIRNTSDTNWILLGCTQKLWYDTSKESDALNQNAGAVARCFYVPDTNEWGELSTGNWYFNFAYVLWCNYDIPINSASGGDIYKYGSLPTSTPMHLVKKWNASIGNNAFELSLTMTGCTPGNTLIIAYAVRNNNNVFTLPTDWTVLGGGTNVSTPEDSQQRIFFAYKKVTSTSEYVSIKQTIGTLIYVVCSEYAGVDRVVLRSDMAAIGTVNYRVTGTKEKADDVILYAVTSAYYGSGRNQTVTPADLDKLEGDEGAERLACWFDGGLGALSHTFQSHNSTKARDAVLECVQLLEKPPTVCICGNVVGHAVPQSDWAQTDKTRADFIKNKPDQSGYVTKNQLDTVIEQALADYVTTEQHNTAIQQALTDYVTTRQLEDAIQQAILDSWEEAY